MRSYSNKKWKHFKFTFNSIKKSTKLRKKIMMKVHIPMEKEIEDIKKKDTNKEIFEGFGHDGKRIVVKDVTSDNNFNPKMCSSPKKKVDCSKLKDKQDGKKKSEIKEVFFTCDNCDFKSKKEEHLKKHKITKHEDHM